MSFLLDSDDEWADNIFEIAVGDEVRYYKHCHAGNPQWLCHSYISSISSQLDSGDIYLVLHLSDRYTISFPAQFQLIRNGHPYGPFIGVDDSRIKVVSKKGGAAPEQDTGTVRIRRSIELIRKEANSLGFTAHDSGECDPTGNKEELVDDDASSSSANIHSESKMKSCEAIVDEVIEEVLVLEPDFQEETSFSTDHMEIGGRGAVLEASSVTEEIVSVVDCSTDNTVDVAMDSKPDPFMGNDQITNPQFLVGMVYKSKSELLYRIIVH
jgi:hypothetical protein